MENMNFIMFCLGALSLAIGLVAMPYVNQLWYALKSRIKRRKNTPNVYCDDLSKRIDELDTQVNNLAERLATRERNRKYNTRRDVRDYLAELRDEK